MLYSRSKDYMFRPVVAIIRSVSFVFIQLYKTILSESNDKDLMMATTGRNM